MTWARALSIAARAIMLGPTLVAISVSPAADATEAKTRLVSCDAGSCLVVTGHRDDATAAVMINAHPVSVRGSCRWRISLPVATVRQWSAPYARTIAVEVEGVSDEVDLPIGLLGHAENLAMLVVRVN